MIATFLFFIGMAVVIWVCLDGNEKKPKREHGWSEIKDRK